MLAITSFGQDLPRPIGHELVVWEVHSASGARYSGLWRRIPQKWAHEAAARGGLSLAVLNAERQVTAKPHGLLPGLHQENTLTESVACQRYLRQVSVLDFPHGLLQNAALLEERRGTQLQRAVHLRVHLETDPGANRRDWPHLIHVKWVKGHARPGSTPVCRRAELSCKGLFLGLVGELLGSS